MPQSRERIGRFINASGEEIAITPNTSHGANLVALGLDWQGRAIELLLCDNEFPSNALPWLALRSRGVDVVELDTQRERLTPDRLRRELTSRTRAVTVSWVSYSDGYRHDLAGLAEVAHAGGALLCVDAIQGLGAFPLDVRATDIDMLYTAAQKWLLGLQGVGFIYVRRDLIDRLLLAMPGWRSVEDIWDFHNHDQGFSPHALRFEGGTVNLLGTLSMTSSIGILERAGIDAIAAHVLQLTDRLVDGLHRIGARGADPARPGNFLGNRFVSHARLRQRCARPCAAARRDRGDAASRRNSGIAARLQRCRRNRSLAGGAAGMCAHPRGERVAEPSARLS